MVSSLDSISKYHAASENLTGSKKGSNIKTSSGSLLKNSLNQKSITSASGTNDRIEKSHSATEVFVPEIIPEFKEAWDMFVNDKNSTYKTLLEEYINNENIIRITYELYLSEIKSMENIRHTVNFKKRKLIEAEMMKKFNNNLQTICDAETTCQEDLNTAENSLLKQQEIVLNQQTEFKIHLSMRQNIKERLSEDFNDFCKNKFTTIVPNLGEDVLIDPTIANLEEKTGDDKSEEIISSSKSELHNIKSNQLDNLKKLMEKEIKQKKIYREKHKQWINNCN